MCTIIFQPTPTRMRWFAEKNDNRLRILEKSRFAFICVGPFEETPRVLAEGRRYFVQLGDSSQSTLRNLGIDDFSKISSLCSINGSFALIDIKEDEVTIVSDRFGSIPVFYARLASGEVVISTGYQSLIGLLTPEETGTINEEAIYEFLYMRRLFGTKTYHSNVECLASATCMQVSTKSKKIRMKTYWKPKSEQLSNVRECSQLLEESLEKAVNRKLADDEKKHGLMLSGGLDSRVLLAIGRDRYTSFTNTPKINNEYYIAAELAKLAGSRHFHILRPTNYFSRIFERAITCSNAMTVFYECQFLDYIEELAQHVDTVHLGIGLDILFCGHYMAKYHPTIAGRPMLYFRERKNISHNLEKLFLKTVSYRLKTSSLTEIIAGHKNAGLLESLESSIHEKMDIGRGYGLSGHSLWEFMHLTDFGRHYSVLMGKSLTSRLNVRIPALDNDLYDLSFLLSPKAKINWRAYQQALTRISPELMKVKNSNTNITASYSLFQQSFIQVMRSISRRLSKKHVGGLPGWSDRSWPVVARDMEDDEMIRKTELMVKFGKINDLSFIDQKKVETMYADHTSGKSDHSVLLGLLLTVEYGLLSYSAPTEIVCSA